MMHRRAQKGFTLVETLVAIAIITIVIGTPFYAAVRSINAAENARDELTGNMLAQEGIEYVVNVRNNNYISNYLGTTRTWLYGVDGNGGPNCFGANKCTVSAESLPGPAYTPGSGAVSICPSGVCGALYLDSATGFYTQLSSTGFTKTRFTRYVQLSTVSTNEVKIVATVTWATNHVNYTTSVTEYLDNWLNPS